MIEAIYERGVHKLTVTGHAGSAEKGKDIVCAAASTLAYTLAANVAELGTDKKRVRRVQIDLNDGSAVIGCDPVHGLDSVTTLIFDAVCMGFDLLAQRYPQFIKYEVRG